MLVSFDTVEKACKVVRQVRKICSYGHFNFTQIISNQRRVLDTIPSQNLKPTTRDLDFVNDDLPMERALGVVWNLQDYMLGFRIQIQDKPLNRRGILSTIHSIYDPLGIVGPAVLPAKHIFQELCRRGDDWDANLPDQLSVPWKDWLEGLSSLDSYQIPRWYGSEVSNTPAQLLIFCDGSETGYGAVAYLITPSLNGNFQSSLVMAKSRLAPLKKISIPRLELTAAKLGLSLMVTIQREIPLITRMCYLWSDSETVLKYLKNEKTRFQRFVSNRISFIRERTELEQWKFVPGKLNPADIASRGLPVRDFVTSQMWKRGPEFLCLGIESWPTGMKIPEVDDNDPEIKKNPVFCVTAKVEMDVARQFMENVSDWNVLRRSVAGLIKLQAKFRGGSPGKRLMLHDLAYAEKAIFRFLQAQSFEEEVASIQTSRPIRKSSKLRKFTPFLDEDGVLRVGGRLSNARHLTFDQRHPIILAKGHIATLLVRATHARSGHLGRAFVINRLRERFRIIGEGSLVKTILNDCISCRKYQGKVEAQVMADLPQDRVMGNNPPFTNTGVDLFGPFKTTRGRALQDRYGLIFKCLSSRAAHIEIVYDKSTDSFIQALRRFISRRGQVKLMRSDNGTNFIGAERELRENFQLLKQDEISQDMMNRGIEWVFNPPYSHHFGGVWEREIRTIRKVMSGLMNENRRPLTDESLNTLMCEVEAILNGRPLTPVSDDPNDMEPLTPNHLLLQRSGPTYPPGIFRDADQYAKHRWRQVQHLADVFWKRWSREYVTSLVSRSKWQEKRRNVSVNDLVLLVMENTMRSQWPLGRIMETYPDGDGNVRTVKIKTVKGEYRRPISQVVVLRPA
ncbi:uncharacterized protein LOC131891740 [Tigriopus californicus]|uniref:uncharacterized protein LOC131891740 n=1 Tax=Tigriopus californicus TaxID=6832 RepID=UPI0027DA0E34|nr:uncharacterized protein LOC131891740 [Tigriopus californicus]